MVLCLFKKEVQNSEVENVTQQIEELSARYVAEILLEDGYLLPRKFEIYKSLTESLYPFKLVEDTALRVRLLTNMVNNRMNESVFPQLLEDTVHLHMTAEVRKIIIEHILLALAENVTYYPKRIEELDMLIKAFGLKRAEFTERIDFLEWEDKRNVDYSVQQKNGFLMRNPFQTTSKSNQVNHLFSFQTSRSKENEEVLQFVQELKKLNKIIDSDILEKEIAELLPHISEQTYRIAIVGEIKHGKSSLFNRLLGEEISPVGEGVATTATIVELHYNTEAKYEAEWISNEGLQKRLQYIEQNKGNLHVQEYAFTLENLVNQPYFEENQVFNHINSMQEITHYTTTKGQYAAGVELVKIFSPVPCLKHGAILIDTPGLNDPMKVRDSITKEQAIMADCILFVMRADKFGTESERQFLIEVLNKTRASSLKIIITHIDRMQINQDYESIRHAVREWLNRVCDHPLVYSAQIYLFNASYRETKPEEELVPGAGFQSFVQMLAAPINENEQNIKYVSWLSARKGQLATLMQKEVAHFIGMNEEQSSSFNQIETLINQLEHVSQAYENQLEARIELMRDRLQSDYKTLVADSEKTKQLITEKLRASIEGKVRELGSSYTSKDKWSVFYKDTATNVVRANVQQMQYNAQSIAENWEQLIKEFDDSLHLDFHNNMEKIKEIHGMFNELSVSDQRLKYALCKADETFSMLNQTLKKGVALGAGYIIATGLKVGAIKTLFTSAAAIAFPPALPWVIGGITIAAVTLKLTSVFDKDKQKYNFIVKKENEIAESLDNMFRIYDENLEKCFMEYHEKLENGIDQVYIPIIKAARANIQDLKLQMQISKRIKNDILTYSEVVLSKSSKKELSFT